MPKLPTNMAALSLIAAVIVAGLISALAFAGHDVPSILTWAEAAFIGGGLGIAQPPPPPVA
jgi:hypothetical protein